MRLALFILAIIALSTSCSSGLFGPQGSAYEVRYIAEVTTIPEVVHTGDTVLIRYRIDTETIHDSGIYGASFSPPQLTARLGSVTPVLATDYTAGGDMPDFITARDNYEATQFIFEDKVQHDLSGVWQEPFYYMLYKAPDFAVEEEIFFRLGVGGPSSNKARHTLKLKVRE